MTNPTVWENNIRANGSALPVDFDPQSHNGLIAYAALLKRWNNKMNLVGRQDIDRLWPRHIEDSLFLYRCLPQRSQSGWVLDVGSGGGLPGMVLAIADSNEPGRNFVLFDRSERKVRFLTQVAAELKLKNVVTMNGDFTQPITDANESLGLLPDATGARLAVPAQFPVICARAVAPPDELWDNLQHLLADNGELLVACGPQTREQLPSGVQVEWYENRASNGRGVVRLFGNK